MNILNKITGNDPAKAQKDLQKKKDEIRAKHEKELKELQLKHEKEMVGIDTELKTNEIKQQDQSPPPPPTQQQPPPAQNQTKIIPVPPNDPISSVIHDLLDLKHRVAKLEGKIEVIDPNKK